MMERREVFNLNRIRSVKEMHDDPEPAALSANYEGLSLAQAQARTFYTRITTADHLGLSLSDQNRFHTQWAAALDLRGKQKVLQDLFLWMLQHGGNTHNE